MTLHRLCNTEKDGFGRPFFLVLRPSYRVGMRPPWGRTGTVPESPVAQMLCTKAASSRAMAFLQRECARRPSIVKTLKP